MLQNTLKSLIKASIDVPAHWFGTHRRTAKAPRLWVLMYHRILPQQDPRYAIEEPGMVVEPETFRMHLQLLKQFFTVISLHDWINAKTRGEALPMNACAITFDDGWADNAEFAQPILEQEELPATLFAVSHMIGTAQRFWPNQVLELLKRPASELAQYPWLAPLLPDASQTTPVSRETSAHIIDKLKAYPDHQLHQWLAELQQAELQQDETLAPGLMSWQQLKAWSDSPLLDVGSHTCHHFRLQEQLGAELIDEELRLSKAKLETELGKPIELFCYPNGDVSDLARQLVEKYYRAAVTTQTGINQAADTDAHQIMRVGIHQDRCNTAVRFSSRLANWR